MTDILNTVRARDVGVAHLYGEVDIGAVGAVGVSTAYGFTVTRAAIGDYRCTLDRGFPEFLWGRMGMLFATRTDGTTHIKARDMTARTVDFYYNAAGIAADPPSGAKLFFILVLKDSTVGP